MIFNFLREHLGFHALNVRVGQQIELEIGIREWMGTGSRGLRVRVQLWSFEAQ